MTQMDPDMRKQLLRASYKSKLNPTCDAYLFVDKGPLKSVEQALLEFKTSLINYLAQSKISYCCARPARKLYIFEFVIWYFVTFCDEGFGSLIQSTLNKRNHG